jgi:hypothetical protein
LDYPKSSLDSEDFDIEQFFLPYDLDLFGMSIWKRLPRHQAKEPFLKGPIPLVWIQTACQLPGVGLHVALILRFLRDRFRFGRDRRWSLAAIAKGLRVSTKTVRRGLHAAQSAGLLSATCAPGCKMLVADMAILALPGSKIDPDSRPLFGPVPFAWLLPVLRLEGSALRVALACWLQAGWERSAEFELSLSEWNELALPRQSASRGLEQLEQAALVSVVRRSGQSPIVTILEPARPKTNTTQSPNFDPTIIRPINIQSWDICNNQLYSN